MPNTSVAARLRRRTLPSGLKIISAAGMVSSVASRSACAASTRRRDSAVTLASSRDSLERQRQLALAHLHRLDHLRERIDQDADFVRPQCLMRGGEIAVLDAVRRVGQLGQRIEDDPLGREHHRAPWSPCRARRCSATIVKNSWRRARQQADRVRPQLALARGRTPRAASRSARSRVSLSASSTSGESD